MYKLSLITLILSTFSFAQITVNSSDFATGGDTVRISITNGTGLDFSTTGPNKNWDFSSLVPTSQFLDTFHTTSTIPLFAQFVFGNFAPTKYKASYFKDATSLPLSQLTFLPVTINNIFQYTRLTADSMTSVGYSMVINNNEIPYKSDTIEKNYDFPIQYGNTTYSRGYTKIDMNPVYNAILKQHRVHSSSVDGWGSIKTPYGTFNALRIKHEIIEIDSISLTVASFPTTLPLQNPLRREYEWWTNGEKAPILKISTSETQGIENITAVQYRDIYRGLDASLINLKSNSILFFPNPSSEDLTIINDGSIKKIEITDLQGNKVIEFEDLKSQSNKINIAILQKGFYLLQIETSKGTIVQSFEKL
jgi:hypothetical protein